MVERSREQAPAGTPGEGLEAARMPGHWLLARLGMKVPRPGGLELSRCMISALGIDSGDAVVESAPGFGVTARITLAYGPASYTGIERDEAAARWAAGEISGSGEFVVGNAAETGLPDAGATVVYGEAMLTMQREPEKRRIAAEAYWLLAPGGRYGIHELCVADGPDAEEVGRELSRDPRRGQTADATWVAGAAGRGRLRGRSGGDGPDGAVGAREACPGRGARRDTPVRRQRPARRGGAAAGLADASRLPPEPAEDLRHSTRRQKAGCGMRPPELWVTLTSEMCRIAQELPASESYGIEEREALLGFGVD